MNLQLATVVIESELGCDVQLLDASQSITAVYSPAMIEYGIMALTGDLVVILLESHQATLLYRWKKVQIVAVQNDQVTVLDQLGQQYPLPTPSTFLDDLKVGEALFTDNTAVIDISINNHPSNPDRLQEKFFPQIKAMYPQLDPNFDPKQIVAQGYDQIAEEHLSWSKTIRQQEREKYTSLVLKQLPKEAALLDLGCGSGMLTTQTLAEKFQVTGVDISQRHIEMAMKNVPDAQFIHADMMTLDYPANCFDGIVSFYALFHLPKEEQKQLLKRVANWLRPNGLFVASLGASANHENVDHDWLGTTMYWSSHDGETNRKLVEETGLEIVQAEVETAVEFERPIPFLWIVARKR